MGKYCGGDDTVRRASDDRSAMGQRKIRVDRPAEDDDAVRRTSRGIPWGKSGLQRIEQQLSERRKSAYGEQQDGSHHELATKEGKSRGQENRAEHTDA